MRAGHSARQSRLEASRMSASRRLIRVAALAAAYSTETPVSCAPPAFSSRDAAVICVRLTRTRPKWLMTRRSASDRHHHQRKDRAGQVHE